MTDPTLENNKNTGKKNGLYLPSLDNLVQSQTSLDLTPKSRGSVNLLQLGSNHRRGVENEVKKILTERGLCGSNANSSSASSSPQGKERACKKLLLRLTLSAVIKGCDEATPFDPSLLYQLPTLMDVDIQQGGPTMLTNSVDISLGESVLLKTRVSLKYLAESVSEILILISQVVLQECFNSKDLLSLTDVFKEVELNYLGIHIILGYHSAWKVVMATMNPEKHGRVKDIVQQVFGFLRSENTYLSVFENIAVKEQILTNRGMTSPSDNPVEALITSGFGNMRIYYPEAFEQFTDSKAYLDKTGSPYYQMLLFLVSLLADPEIKQILDTDSEPVDLASLESLLRDEIDIALSFSKSGNLQLLIDELVKSLHQNSPQKKEHSPESDSDENPLEVSFSAQGSVRNLKYSNSKDELNTKDSGEDKPSRQREGGFTGFLSQQVLAELDRDYSPVTPLRKIFKPSKFSPNSKSPNHGAETFQYPERPIRTRSETDTHTQSLLEKSTKPRDFSLSCSNANLGEAFTELGQKVVSYLSYLMEELIGLDLSDFSQPTISRLIKAANKEAITLLVSYSHNKLIQNKTALELAELQTSAGAAAMAESTMQKVATRYILCELDNLYQYDLLSENVCSNLKKILASGNNSTIPVLLAFKSYIEDIMLSEHEVSSNKLRALLNDLIGIVATAQASTAVESSNTSKAQNNQLSQTAVAKKRAKLFSLSCLKVTPEPRSDQLPTKN